MQINKNALPVRGKLSCCVEDDGIVSQSVPRTGL